MPLTLLLARGREQAPRRRHPWLFTGSVAGRSGNGEDGRAEVRDSSGALVASGFLSPRSPLMARLWAFGNEPVDAGLVARRVLEAVELRRRVVPEETDGYRVVNAEGDFLPGLVVDRFGEALVVQAVTEGTERARPLWLPPLLSAFPGATLVQKNGLPSRRGEKLRTEDELLSGEQLPGRMRFRERGLSFVADLASGQKTGFFLDQRENRQVVRLLSGGKSLLNAFSYSGAFGVAALAGGAREVSQVDLSAEALELARENHRLNGQEVEGPNARVRFCAADVFEDLRVRVAAGERWDVIVTDPPAFAKKREDVDRACRGYKDVNRLALKLLAPFGTLLACSCSGVITPDLFQKVLFSASLDAGVPVRLLERRGAGPDHPVSIDCPETDYLKAFRLERTG